MGLQRGKESMHRGSRFYRAEKSFFFFFFVLTFFVSFSGRRSIDALEEKRAKKK